jgi:hypothetical protein
VSLVPALTLAYFRNPELTAVPVESPGLARRILVVQRKGRRLSAPAQAMLDLVERKIGRAASRARR